MVESLFAHIAEDGRTHLLKNHLEGTAALASAFASEFGCGEWGYLAGLWHDLGKYSEDFQRKIHAVATGGPEAKAHVDHSTAGAIYSTQQFNRPNKLPLGNIIAYLAAGHHAGLADWHGDETGRKALSQRLYNAHLFDAVLWQNIPADIINQPLPKEKPRHGADPAFWIRMLFSCLVDADFIDTEAFFDSGKAGARKGFPSIHELLPMFAEYMTKKQNGVSDTSVNLLRADIFRQCTDKSAHEPGIFTLTVPTGGGKTLSSMSFALHHALLYGKKRVIYVIPYTSIIEQAADQFRQIFGEAVIEHHSNIAVSEDDKDESSKSRLASENWDAPIIVTTTVQFFESLFASRTSRCRKLHNIVNSVVVLDEAQLFPPEFLNPILFAIQELQKNYGVTILLSTATQPALGEHQAEGLKFQGLKNMLELMGDPAGLHRSFERVKVNIPDDLQSPRTWEDLAFELQQHPSVLCIVNRRDDCRQLWEKMPEGTIHLSALMCGAHRSKVIGEIKDRLDKEIPTRVISTQLVEAGVDIDFPVVYRAIAGLASIAQAAGRCNREGLLEKGQVFVFIPPSKIPVGYLRQTAEIGRRILFHRYDDPLAPELFESFFKELYWLQGDNLDKNGILRDLGKDAELRFSFRTAANKFHLIDESAQGSLIVRYGEGEKLIALLENKGPERWLMRKLQRYVVNLPRYLHKKLLNSGALMEIAENIFVQGHTAMYDENLGFCSDRSLIYEPDDLIA